MSEQISNYERSEVLDDHRVRFHFSAPSPGFAQATSTMNAGLLADSTLTLDAEGFGPGGATQIHTCGPFHITAETIGTKLSVRAREDYDWAPPHLDHQGRAHLDGIDYLVNNEYSVRIEAVLSGQADGVRDVQAPDDTRDRAGTAPLRESDERDQQQHQLPLPPRSARRCRRPAGADRRHRPPGDRRQALHPRTTRSPPGCWPRARLGYTDQSGSWEYDPDRANRLLDEAGASERNGQGYRVKDGSRWP